MVFITRNVSPLNNYLTKMNSVGGCTIKQAKHISDSQVTSREISRWKYVLLNCQLSFRSPKGFSFQSNKYY